MCLSSQWPARLCCHADFSNEYLHSQNITWIWSMSNSSFYTGQSTIWILTGQAQWGWIPVIPVLGGWNRGMRVSSLRSDWPRLCSKTLSQKHQSNKQKDPIEGPLERIQECGALNLYKYGSALVFVSRVEHNHLWWGTGYALIAYINQSSL